MNATRGLVADVIRSSFVDGPGNRYVVFLQGCTFNCLACHNPQTIGQHPTPTTRDMTVDDVVADIVHVAPFISGVTVSGGEATCQWEFVDALFRRLAEHPTTARLTRLIDSNGDAEPEVWVALADSMHGVMVDLKALDPDVHQLLTGRDNDRVLASIRRLDELDRLAEVRLLLIPGFNDGPRLLAATAAFLGELSSSPPIVLLAFRHEGTRPIAEHMPEATADDLHAATRVLVESGIERQRVRIAGVVG